MSKLRPLIVSLALLLLGLGVSPRASAADCASCNGVSNTAACCRKIAGCEAYASKQAGVNFCRSAHASKDEPKQKVSGAQCQKNYNTCVHNAQSSGGSMKSVEVDGKKLSRKDLAEALSAARKTCQDRLSVCKQHAQ